MENEEFDNLATKSQKIQDEINDISRELLKNDIQIDEQKIANHVENKHLNNASKDVNNDNDKIKEQEAYRHFKENLGTETNNITKNISSELANLKTLIEEFFKFLKENKEIQKLSNSETVKNAKETLSQKIDNNSLLKGAVVGLATGGVVGAIRGGALAGAKSLYDSIKSNNEDNSDVLSKDAIFNVLHKKKTELENIINEHIENMDISEKDVLKSKFKDIVKNLDEDMQQDDEISNFIDQINGNTSNKELVKEATEDIQDEMFLSNYGEKRNEKEIEDNSKIIDEPSGMKQKFILRR